VTPYQSQRMFRAAGEPKELFVSREPPWRGAYDRPEAYEGRRPRLPGRHLDGEPPVNNRADLHSVQGAFMAHQGPGRDDDLNIQRVLVFALKQEGYEGHGRLRWRNRRGDGLDARPDLILMDVGDAQAGRLWRHPADPGGGEGVGRIPIIMLTSEADVGQRVRGLRAGADDDIVKPFHRSSYGSHQGAPRPDRRPATTKEGAEAPTLGKLCAFFLRRGRGDHHPSPSTRPLPWRASSSVGLR